MTFDYYKPHDEDYIDAVEMKFYQTLMEHRQSLGLPIIPLSSSLTITASRHVLDIMYNGKQPSSGHAWSDVPYNPNDNSGYSAVTASPQRLQTSYLKPAYEILLTSDSNTLWSEGGAASDLDIFISSALHRAVIENLDGWKDLTWKSVGIAIRGSLVSVWFGTEADPAGAPIYVEQDTPISVATSAMGNMRYSGSVRNDIFVANDGTAAFDATGGYDIFVAGSGSALTSFRGRPGDYSIIQDSGTILVQDSVAGRDGTVRLVNFRPGDNFIFYSDGAYELKSVATMLPAADQLQHFNPIVGTGGSDKFLGTAGSDFVAMGNGADVYRFGGGNDIVAAGAGWDVIEFARPLNAYQLRTGPQGYVVTGDEGSVSFTDVELLVFADQLVAVGKPTFFNEEYYLAHNVDVAAAVSSGALPSGYAHWQQYGQREGRLSTTWFDEDYYLAHNPDVAAAVRAGWITAWNHYQAFGAREGRDPSALFDAGAYLDAYPDVRAAGANPLEHWLNYGWGEGRRAAPVDDYLAWG